MPRDSEIQFANGGYLKPGPVIVRNDTGEAERVYTAQQWREFLDGN